MDWQHKSRHLQIETLRYFEKYNYPLNKKELEFWSGTTVKKFTRNLELSSSRKHFIAPLETTDARSINAILKEAVQNILSDEAFLQSLAE